MSTPEGKVRVRVGLRSLLAKYRPQPDNPDPFEMELDVGTTVGELVERLGLPPKLAKLIFVDHSRVEPDAELPAGAHVEIFPPIAGG